MVTKQVSLICVDMATNRSTLHRSESNNQKETKNRYMNPRAEFMDGGAVGHCGDVLPLPFWTSKCQKYHFSQLIFHVLGASKVLFGLPLTH